MDSRDRCLGGRRGHRRNEASCPPALYARSRGSKCYNSGTFSRQVGGFLAPMENPMDGKWFRNSFIWLIVMVFVLAIAFQVFKGQGGSTKSIPTTGGSNSLVGKLQNDIAQKQHVTIVQDGSDVTL